MKNHDTTLLESSTPGDDFVALGASLRSARIDCGLSISDVASNLRMSKDFIRALDSGEFDLLPGVTYVAGYLRSYATVIGLDGSAIVARYQAIRGVAAEKQKYSFPINQPKAERSGAVVASVAVILGLAGYAGWYWSGKPGFDPVAPTTEIASITSPAATNVTDPGTANMLDDPLEPTLAPTLAITELALNDENSDADVTPLESAPSEPLATGEDTGTAVSSVATAAAVPVSDAVEASDAVQPAVDAPAIQPAVDATSTMPTSSEVDGVNNIAAATSAPATPAFVEPVLEPAIAVGERTPDRASAIATPREPELEITLRATASSWVEIVRNDGEEVMTKLMRDGDTYLIDGGANLYLSTGNAGGLEFVFPDGAVLPAGDVGEILRDLPLKADGLLASL